LHLSQQATFLTRNQGFEAYLTAENRVNDIGARSELKNNVDVFLQQGKQVIARSTNGGKKAEAIASVP